MTKFLPPWLLPLIAALVVAGLMAGTYRLGHNAADADCAARQAAQQAQAQKDYQARLAKAEQAALAAEQAARAARDFAAALQQEIDHAPIPLARAAARRCPAAGPVPLAAAPAAAPGPVLAAAERAVNEPAPTPGAAPQAAEPGGGARLTLAAVRLWNSALVGAGVPAGACEPADPASPACAADAGLDLTDAWRNHALNAAACAEDRARHRQLIELLQHPGAPTHPALTESVP